MNDGAHGDVDVGGVVDGSQGAHERLRRHGAVADQEDEVSHSEAGPRAVAHDQLAAVELLGVLQVSERDDAPVDQDVALKGRVLRVKREPATLVRDQGELGYTESGLGDGQVTSRQLADPDLFRPIVVLHRQHGLAPQEGDLKHHSVRVGVVLTDGVEAVLSQALNLKDWSALTDVIAALRDKGFEEALIVEAGMAAKPVDGGPAYDRFRGRIVFPIRDGQGRCIGFGGRAMDPNARAKYLNSPETPLFDKGRNLYNLGPARAAVGKGQPLIVAEGYMDVIALSRAGFQGAVAPLGTAITSEQLAAMWRLSPEPVIALDGDAAGQRAAQRLIDLALPLTGPGQALRFVLLPAGQDPDDLIRVAGQGAMKALLDQARPLVDLLWSRETEGQRFDSPERKAALDRRLQQAIARIPDELTRRHYADEIRGKRWQLFGGRRQPRGEGVRQGAAGRGPARRGGASMAPRAPLPTLPVAGPDAGTALLEGASLLICALRPELVALVETRLERLSPRDADRAALLHDLLTGNESEAGRRALEILRSDAQLGLTPPVIGRKDPEAILTMLQNLLDRIEAERAAGPELSRAETEIEGDADEGLTWRFQQVNKARHRAERPELEDSGDLNEDRDKLAAELSDALSRQIWRKPPRR